MPNTLEAPKIFKAPSVARTFLAPPSLGPIQVSGGCEMPDEGLLFPRGVRASSASTILDPGGGAVQPAQSLRNFILSLSPRLYMRMSTLTSEVTPRVLDESDWSNHGSIIGAPAIGGVAGLVTNDVDPATDFDGVDDRISVGVGSGLQLQQLTVISIVKPVSGEAMRLAAYEASDSATTARGYLLEILLDSGALRPAFTAGGNAVGAYNGINAASTISAAARHLIVGSYDGILQKIYIDGALSASKANGSGVISYTNATGLNIGYRGFGGPFFSRGVHDEVAIIPFALSGAQILALYNKLTGAA